jgi:hypothetical protein
MKAIKKLSIIGLFPTLIAGCASSFIDVKEGANKINVATEDKVSKCESKGTVTSNVLSKVLFVSRSIEGIEENLEQMAKNAAVEAGANTITKGESKKVGERSFSLYQCK